MGDSDAGRIATGEGQVIWHRTHYQATVAGRNLRALDDHIARVPGTYRFYYLVRSGWLLSYEPIGTAMQGVLNWRLSCQESWGPTRQRAANRHGVITGGQRLVVSGKMVAGLVLTIGHLLAAGVLASCVTLADCRAMQQSA